MNSFPQGYAELQDQFLEGVKQSQTAVVEAVRAWSDATAKLVPVPAATLPPLPADLPTPQDLVASQFDFAEKLLAAQRDFAQGLAAAVRVPAAA